MSKWFIEWPNPNEDGPIVGFLKGLSVAIWLVPLIVGIVYLVMLPILAILDSFGLLEKGTK